MPPWDQEPWAHLNLIIRAVGTAGDGAHKLEEIPPAALHLSSKKEKTSSLLSSGFRKIGQEEKHLLHSFGFGLVVPDFL